MEDDLSMSTVSGTWVEVFSAVEDKSFDVYEFHPNLSLKFISTAPNIFRYLE